MANPKTRVSLNQLKPSTFSAEYIEDTYAPLNSPSLKGTPTAPTAAVNTNTTQIATTAFVTRAVSNLVNSAPEALDTLKELSDALGEDPNFATTMTNNLATKINKGTTTTGSGNAITILEENNEGKLVATKGSTFSLSNHNHDTTYTKLAKTKGSATKGIYTDSDGVIQPMTYSVNKDVPSNAVFTDTHWQTHIYAGSGGASNATTTNGNTKITIADESTARESITIKGTGATTVTSASGTITINSTNTVTTATTTGSGNAVTAITASNGALTVTKGSTFSLSTHNHDTAYTALKKSIGSATQPVYTNANGVITACTYSLNKTVPSNAVFTDTTYGVVSTSANGLAPKRDGSTTKFLRGDGTWAVPSCLPLSGGTLTGAVTFANNTWNIMGDDCKIGDINVGGCIAIMSNTSTTTGLIMCKAGAQSTQAKITYDGSKVYCNTTFEATKIVGAYYADYAEYFPKGEETEPGDIIVLDIDSDNEQYIKSNASNKIAVGVHSDNYQHIIGGEEAPSEEDYFKYNDKKYIPVALCGRISTKVIGPVHKNDFIVPSDTPGVGKAFVNGVDNPLHIFGIIVEEDNRKDIRRLKVKLK